MNKTTGEQGRHHVHVTIVQRAMIYTHVLNRGPAGVRSPVYGL